MQNLRRTWSGTTRLLTGVAAMLVVSVPMYGATTGEGEQGAGLSEWVTCGVFYRIVAASLMSRSRRTGADLDALTEDARSLLNTAMSAGKRIAQTTDTDFDAVWKTEFQYQIDIIGGSYRDVRRLKLRFEDDCKSLLLDASSASLREEELRPQAEG